MELVATARYTRSASLLASNRTLQSTEPTISFDFRISLSFLLQVGIMHIQLLHTSASLTINENWDPDVRDDMEMMLNRQVNHGEKERSPLLE